MKLILLSLSLAFGFIGAVVQNVAPYVTEKNLIPFFRITRSSSDPTDQAIKDAFVLANPNLPAEVKRNGNTVRIINIYVDGNAMVGVKSLNWEGQFKVKVKNVAEPQGPTIQGNCRDQPFFDSGTACPRFDTYTGTCTDKCQSYKVGCNSGYCDRSKHTCICNRN